MKKGKILLAVCMVLGAQTLAAQAREATVFYYGPGLLDATGLEGQILISGGSRVYGIDPVDLKNGVRNKKEVGDHFYYEEGKNLVGSVRFNLVPTGGATYPATCSYEGNTNGKFPKEKDGKFLSSIVIKLHATYTVEHGMSHYIASCEVVPEY
jgi:hypothetical protein